MAKKNMMTASKATNIVDQSQLTNCDKLIQFDNLLTEYVNMLSDTTTLDKEVNLSKTRLRNYIKNLLNQNPK